MVSEHNDEGGERRFIAELLAGIQRYVQAIESEPLPGERKLIFLAVAGCRAPDGTTAVQIICNGGDRGIADLIAALEKERIRRSKASP